MERRKVVGLVVLAAGFAVLMTGITLERAGAPEALGLPFLTLGGLVMNPITLAVVLFLMFRRPAQQQQQIVIQLGAQAGGVLLQCPGCRSGNAPGARFCAGCGRAVA